MRDETVGEEAVVEEEDVAIKEEVLHDVLIKNVIMDVVREDTKDAG